MCVLTRGVSSIRVFHRALGGASSEMRIRRHAAFSFVRDVGCLSGSGQEDDLAEC
jgi:hypothetical protein